MSLHYNVFIFKTSKTRNVWITGVIGNNMYILWNEDMIIPITIIYYPLGISKAVPYTIYKVPMEIIQTVVPRRGHACCPLPVEQICHCRGHKYIT